MNRVSAISARHAPRLAAIAAVTLVVLGMLGDKAGATFQGVNGKLAYYCGGTVPGPLRMCTSNPDGSDVQVVAYGGVRPAWSPGGQQIAFAVVSDTGRPALEVASADGSDRHGVASSGDNPSWSPDGMKLAFDDGNDVIVANSDGTAPIRLTNSGSESNPPSSYVSFGAPAWSPDGARIAFVRSEAHGCGGYPPCEAQGELWVMHSDGTERVRYAQDASGQPHWSPDGAKLAFTAGRYPELRAMVVNSDGSGLAPLPIDGRDPNWSPDGHRLVFDRFDNGVQSQSVIYTADLDGRNVTRVCEGQWADWQALPAGSVTSGGEGGQCPGPSAAVGGGPTGGSAGNGPPAAAGPFLVRPGHYARLRRGRILLRLRCLLPSAPCAGHLSLAAVTVRSASARRMRLGTTRFSIAAGKTAIVKVKVRRRSDKRLSRLSTRRLRRVRLRAKLQTAGDRAEFSLRLRR